MSTACPVCCSRRTQRVIEIRDVPVFCNILLDSREEAVDVRKGDILLDHCHDCGHLFNSAFDPSLVAYEPIYENSLHFSPRFQEYARALAQELVDRYALCDKQIVEIGSGQGDFLTLLCDLGGNRGIGFDPSSPPSNGDRPHPRVSLVADYYSERYADLAPNFVCSRHTLEHVLDPVEFVRTVRMAAGGNPGVPVYIEVPNALYTLRDLGVWDLIYEHRSYFGSSSLRRLLECNGFDVQKLSERYAGQFLSVEAVPAPRDAMQDMGGHDTAANDTDAFIPGFAEEYRRKVETSRELLNSVKLGERKCVVWGAGSKGVTFLNALQVNDEVRFVVDLNTRKQGRFVSGTGQEIVSPDFLRKYQPDLALVMNPIYVDEIAAMLRALDVPVELLVM